MKHTKTIIKLLGYLLSAFFLYLTFKNTDFYLIVTNFKYINIYFLLIVIILNFLFFIIRALYQKNNLSYINSNIAFDISITSIAYAQFFNNIFPARLGEVVRTFFLSKKSGIKKTSVLSYIFIEKIFDFVLILILLFLIMMFGFVNIELGKIFFVSVIFIASVSCLLFFYIRFNNTFIFIIKKVIPQKAYAFSEKINLEIITGVSFFKTFKQVLRSLILLLLSWILVALMYFFISYPYLKLLNLPWYSCLFFMVFSVLSLSIPSAPSGIGVMHYGLFLAVKLLSKGDIFGDINLISAFVIILHFTFMSFDLIVSGSIILFNKIYNGKKTMEMFNL